MEAHHKAYLGKHSMSPEFLSEALRNGFDVHHLDGDHSNNEPENLILVWSQDHMELHGLKRFSGRMDGVWMTREEMDAVKLSKGEAAYQKRLQSIPWAEMGIPNALGNAKHYAKAHDLEWPVPCERKKPMRSHRYRKGRYSGF